MKISQIGTIQRALFLLILLISSGCAQQMKTVQPDTVAVSAVSAEILGINVSDDGAKVEILSNKPIVYTYYTLESPNRLIVDLANTSPARISYPISVNKGSLTKIDVTKHEFGSGVLSRVEISLTTKLDVTAQLDQQNKGRLVINLPIPAPLQQQESAAKQSAPAADTQPVVQVKDVEPKPAVIENEGAAQEPAKSEAPRIETVSAAPAASVALTTGSKTVLKAGERALTAIKKSDDGLMLEFSAEPESFKAFKLGSPERFVIDVPKTTSAVDSKPIDINAFNLGKGRIGVSPERLRIVFDAQGGSIPAHTLTKSGSVLALVFGGAAIKTQSQKAEAVKSETILPEPGKIDPVSTELKIAEPVKAEPAQEGTAKAEAAKEEAVKTETVKEELIKAEAAKAESVKVEPPVAEDKSGSDTVKPVEAAVPAPAAPVALPVPAAPPAAPVVAAVPVPLPAPPVSKKSFAGVVEAIEFTQAEGISRVTVRTSGDCRAGDPVKTSKGLLLTVKSCRMPANLQRKLDTHGFDSVIKGITPSVQKKGAPPEAKILVSLKMAVSNSVKRDKDVLQWDFKEPLKKVKPLKMAKAAKAAFVRPTGVEGEMGEARQPAAKSVADKAMDEAFVLEKESQPTTKQGKVYSGRKVTLEFSDADIRKIFQLIAEVSNQNFLVSDDVTGTISLKLVNVPWDQALDVILENKGLGMQKTGNIVQIRPKTKMKSLDDEAIEMRVVEEKKLPLSSVIFDVNFAGLGDIETQFKSFKRSRSDWSVSSDARTNKVIVTDTEPNINKMRKLLEQLDIPERQVMIEARIVEASSNFARDIGVKWNFGYTDGTASIGNINNLTGSMGGVVTNILPTGTTGGLATGMSFGKLLSNIQLDMRLSAAATVGQLKIISTPRVLTVNNKAAKISQGQMIPYQNTSSTDGAKTEFIEAALSLEVTPHITSDGSVNMKIKASNNTAGIGSPPPINKKEATTELVVKNGETTVIGGIYVDSDTEGETGIPYLSSIPLLGWLFKSNSQNKSKNELLIFITPKIMN